MHCILCHELVLHQVVWSNLFLPSEKKVLCEECEIRFDIIDGPVCLVCNRPMIKSGVCPDCERWEKNKEWTGVLERNISVVSYNEFMQDAIARWKYRGDYIVVEVFKESVRESFTNNFSSNDMEIVPIPLSEERKRERGFNQAEAIARMLDRPFTNALTRVHSEKQSKKNRQERISSDNPFSLLSPLKKPVVLIDDIYTTGITLRHAAKLLKDSGCPKVYSMTLVRS